jgi:hypothetical protein
MKYKKSINCNRPKGFSQKQYCKYGRKNGGKITRKITRKKIIKQKPSRKLIRYEY